MMLGEIVEFCRRHGPPLCFGDWPVQKMLAWLSFHAAKKTLVVIEDNGRPVGVVTWTRFGGDLKQEDAMEHAWDYDTPDGRRIYWSGLIATSREAFRACWEGFKTMVPDWRELEYVSHRRGRLMRYPRSFVKKMEGL